MAKVAVVLTGCGRLDGTDVHEAVLVYAALERGKHTYISLAPEGDQQVVADHASATFDESGETRNMFQESTRLAPGPVRPLKEGPTAMLDGVILPGGAGAFRGLCEPGGQGIGGGELLPDVRRFLQAILDKGGRVGAVGMAVVVLDRLLHRPLGSGTGGPDRKPERVIVDPDGSTAHCSGLVWSSSLLEVEAGIGHLVNWVATGSCAKE